MIVQIPLDRETDQSAHWEQQVTLEGDTYTLVFRWNVRLGAWFMHVLDSAGEAAFQVGLRIVVDYRLNQFSADRRPTGHFVAIDTATPVNRGEDPTFENFGSRVQLYYLPAS